MSQVQQVQSAKDILASLGITGQNVVKLPTGEFTGGGFVGPLMAGHFHSTGIEGELIENSGAATVQGMGDWGNRYYFVDKAVADAFAKDNGAQYDSSATHRIELGTRSVIASQEQIAKLLGEGDTRGFGEVISGEVAVRTLSSKKYRHEWQLVGFPAIVHAAARLFGFEVPDFDISELRNQDTAFTDELFAKLCGNPDAKAGDEDHYTESVYYKQRAAIWAALGEPDPTKCHVTAEGTKWSTESAQLDACFQIALSSWSAPIWGRLRLVADPRVDAVSGNGNRLSLGIVTDLYASESAAREAAGDDDGAGTSAPSAPAGPQVPDEYAGLDNALDIWKGELERTKAMPPAVAAGQVGVDVSHVLVWREHLGL